MEQINIHERIEQDSLALDRILAEQIDPNLLSQIRQWMLIQDSNE